MTAITVGATTDADARAGYPNAGSILDIFAPGPSATAGWYAGDTATDTISDTTSGTSMATPHVAGAAAVHRAGHTSATPAEFSTALVNGATPDIVISPGAGSPSRLLRVVSSPLLSSPLQRPGWQLGSDEREFPEDSRLSSGNSYICFRILDSARSAARH